MLVVFPSGSFYCFKDACGINFWGVNGHDAIWHLAIANVSFNKFPFVAPTFSGENLYGYNYLLDFFIFLLTKIGISSITTYFKIFPVVWFIIFTLLLVILARKVKDDKLFVALFLFFNYFAGSFSYFLTLYHHGTINGSSTLLPQPIMHMMSNLSYAFSLLFLLWILILLKEKNTLKNIFFIGIALFFILGLKFYGIISLCTVGVYLLFDLLKKFKRTFIYFIILGFFSSVAVIFFYNPFQSVKTGAVFGFAPFALVHPITESPDQFYLQHLTDARYFLIQHGIGPRLIAIESLNLLIFLFFYLGTRFFGLIYLLIMFVKGKLDRFDISIFVTIIFATLLTLLLVQKAQWWNTIQFFLYVIFLSTIYLTKLVYALLKNKKIISYILVSFIILLSIPTSYDLIRLFMVTPGATYVSKEEMKALDFLSRQPEGAVLTPLYNEKWKDFTKSNDIYTYADTAYVSAFFWKTYLFFRFITVDSDKCSL